MPENRPLLSEIINKMVQNNFDFLPNIDGRVIKDRFAQIQLLEKNKK